MILILLLPLFLLADTNAQSPNQLYDYRCQQPNGFEAVPRKCDEYVECKDNKAIHHTCPDGLHFNSNTQWPSYPCGYPFDVKCGESDEVQQPQPTAECSHRYGFYREATGDCGTYTLCHEGVASTMNCPFGLAFNSRKAICDWPSNVPGCSSREFEPFWCPEAQGEDYHTIRVFRYDTSCSHFIACIKGHGPRILACEPGLSFDEKSELCVKSQYVLDCDPTLYELKDDAHDFVRVY